MWTKIRRQVDKAGNRLSAQFEDKNTGTIRRQTASVNAANQITATSNDGPVFVSGSMDEQGKISFLNRPTATTDAAKAFAVWADSPATDRFTLNVKDWRDNPTTATFEFPAEDKPTYAFEYDANGNTTRVVETSADRLTTIETIYERDALDQLIAVEKGNQRSEFQYDGMGRRVRVTERLGGMITAERTFLWEGLSIVEERGAAGASVAKQFYPQGEKRGGDLRFYTRDHLGSTREVTDETGAFKARFAYDPYGQVTQVAGSEAYDFLYTGHFHHAASGLHLAPYRAYDARFGRWLSRSGFKTLTS